ncbi:MAG: serine/threonine-protein kinase [Planctomycetota bacterium]
MKVHCPQCQGTFRVEGHSAGSSLECPYCSAAFSFRDKQTIALAAAPDQPVHVEFEPEREAALAQALPLTRSPGPDVQTSAAQPPAGSSISRNPEELTDLRVGDTINGYRLDQIIGSGGMSVVFRAAQLSLNRPVAFKVLRRELNHDPEFASRFRAEARALAELSHPNIVSVFDQGVHHENYYLVMEFVDGVSLRDVISDHRMTPKEALQLVPDLCGALEYAHSKNIVHRDIKPENILLSKEGVPMIADFGLVRIIGDASREESRITKTQVVMGTVDYMAPEQREGRLDIDHRADIYSLGVVLYEMLTGELPIARFPLPSERSTVDARLDGVVMKVLEKDRDRRYQRASLVATDIQRIKDGHAPTTGGGSGSVRTPATVLGRVLTMATSFQFLVVSILLILLMGSSRRDDPLFFFLGLAVPFWLWKLVQFGILPRPVLPRSNFLYRFPIVAGLLFGIVTVVLAENRSLDSEPAMFLVGLTASSTLVALFHRKTLFRDSLAEPHFVPNLGAPRGIFTTQPWNFDKAASALKSSANSARAAALQTYEGILRIQEQHKAKHRQPGQPHAGAAAAVAAVSAAASPAESSSVATSAPHFTPITATPASTSAVDFAGGPAAPATPRVKPYSVLTVFGFLACLPLLLLAVAMFVIGLVPDWKGMILEIPFATDEIETFFKSIWDGTPTVVLNTSWIVGLAPLVPLVIPFVLLFLATPGILGGRKRGTKLYVATMGLLLVILGLQLTVTRVIHSAGARYASAAVSTSVHPSRSASSSTEVATKSVFQAAIEQATRTPDSLERLGLLHRAYSLAAGTKLRTIDNLAPLAEMLRNSETHRPMTMIERFASTLLFIELKPSSADPLGQAEWLRSLIDQAQDEPEERVRCLLLKTISATQSQDERLAPLFLEAIESDDYFVRGIAARWWLLRSDEEQRDALTQRLPLLSTAAVFSLLIEIDPRILSAEPKLRCLIEPLLRHEDDRIRKRASSLLHQLAHTKKSEI